MTAKVQGRGRKTFPEEMGATLAAEYAGWHRTYPSKLAQRGVIGRMYLGRYVFTKTELDAYLAEEHSKGPKPQE